MALLVKLRTLWHLCTVHSPMAGDRGGPRVGWPLSLPGALPFRSGLRKLASCRAPQRRTLLGRGFTRCAGPRMRTRRTRSCRRLGDLACVRVWPDLLPRVAAAPRGIRLQSANRRSWTAHERPQFVDFETQAADRDSARLASQWRESA